MLEYRHSVARMAVAAMSDGAILLFWTRRMAFCRLRLDAHHVRAGMENLTASHQKYGQRANDPELSA
jgi:hypothetical protein